MEHVSGPIGRVMERLKQQGQRPTEDTMDGDGLFNIDDDPEPAGPPTILNMPLVEAPMPPRDYGAMQRADADFKARARALAEAGFSIERLETEACEEHDGHLTLMRFTTGWKGCFGTPDLDTPDAAREWLSDQPSFPTLDALAVHLLGVPY